MNKIKILFILILFSQFSFSQSRIIYGSVFDDTGYPLPGANIVIEGTKTYTQTDFDGCFSIKVNSDQFLVFTYMGFISQRLSASKNDIDVILQTDHSVKNDCIIPSLPVKKEKFRGAITRISAEEIKQQ
ncbi:carboxypeptidase-like regulatory domain-containing protein [Flavobacterium sp. UBA7680]|uniref:carboxypeptidase-like regulatory domain-containing protein n=1 Tax=Flavobacterium sp. UBA7680 TaxID=1946559 RepID=UPI0025C07373|nr:carboxypeptidase-like regulatory domain-containing protein [Flavobacterium sp. UBA7680]